MPYKDQNSEEAQASRRRNYLKRKEAGKHQANVKRQWGKRRIWLDDIKAGQPCADCGVVFAPECMDFDHIRGVKEFTISPNLHRAKRRILAEIEKCELVCANCHRVRTTRRLRGVA